jgi:hypothetical protein
MSFHFKHDRRLPVLILAAVSVAGAQKLEMRSLARYVPSPHKMVERML